MPPRKRTQSRPADADEVPTRRVCATDEVNERLLRSVSGYAETRSEIENRTSRVLAFGDAVLRTGCTEIPVVVHVVYRNSAENISDAQIESQIAVLNADYRGTNPDRENVPDAWTSLTADPNVQFELAEVTRTETERDSFGTGDTVKRTADGGIDPRPTTKFLNIWVCNLGEGLLGYAQFPGGPARTDGVVILYTAFGTNGVAADPFNLGRTATHEVGHYLNLRHIWGDTNDCSGSDQVSDTPRAMAPNYGKQIGRASCRERVL